MDFNTAKQSEKETDRLMKIRRKVSNLEKDIEAKEAEIMSDIIGQFVKERKELETLKTKKEEEEIKLADHASKTQEISEINFETAETAKKEGIKLIEKRRKLEQLRKDEKKYLKQREEKANALLKDLDKEIEDAGKEMDKLEEIFTGKIKEMAGLQKIFVQGIDSLYEKIEKTTGTVEAMKNKGEKMIKETERGMENLRNLIRDNSEQEKALIKKGKEVDEKAKDTEHKLQKAKDLVFWHKNKIGEKLTE